MTVSKPVRKWEVFPGKNKFFCDGLIITSNQPSVFFLTNFLLLGVTALFYGFDCPYLYRKLSPSIPFIDLAIFIFVLIFLYTTSFMDPGIIPRATRQEVEFTERMMDLPANSQLNVYQPPRVVDVQINGIPMKLKYCPTCKLFRPPRASHCSTCDNCVDRFDHHCPWVGNCIGKRNYRFFYWFVILLTVHCSYIFAFSLTTMILYSIESDILTALKSTPGSIIEILITFVCLWSFIGLAGFHTFLAMCNITTNEDIKSLYTKNQKNPFSLNSKLSNFCFMLFGPVTPSLIDRRGFVKDDCPVARVRLPNSLISPIAEIKQSLSKTTIPATSQASSSLNIPNDITTNDITTNTTTTATTATTITSTTTTTNNNNTINTNTVNNNIHDNNHNISMQVNVPNVDKNANNNNISNKIINKNMNDNNINNNHKYNNCNNKNNDNNFDDTHGRNDITNSGINNNNNNNNKGCNKNNNKNNLTVTVNKLDDITYNAMNNLNNNNIKCNNTIISNSNNKHSKSYNNNNSNNNTYRNYNFNNNPTVKNNNSNNNHHSHNNRNVTKNNNNDDNNDNNNSSINYSNNNNHRFHNNKYATENHNNNNNNDISVNSSNNGFNDNKNYATPKNNDYHYKSKNNDNIITVDSVINKTITRTTTNIKCNNGDDAMYNGVIKNNINNNYNITNSNRNNNHKNIKNGCEDNLKNDNNLVTKIYSDNKSNNNNNNDKSNNNNNKNNNISLSHIPGITCQNGMNNNIHPFSSL